MPRSSPSPQSQVPDDGRVAARAAVPARSGKPAASAANPARFGANEYRGRRRPRWGRIALVSLVSLVVLAGLALGGGLLYLNSLNSDLKRTDPFAGIKESRPARGAEGAINILLLGSDSRDPDNPTVSGKWRTDTMIFLHVPSNHDKAYLISIPRDLYVHIPQSATNPEFGNTKAKINAAFSWGGLPLVVQTIEGYTGVLVDHVVLIDFAGFKQVTDALGGVDLTIEQDVTSIHPPYRQFKAGQAHLDGAQALDYIRQRYQFPEGDFARMRHQQQFVKAIVDKAANSGTLSSPSKLTGFLRSITASMTVDQDFSLTELALQLRGIRGGDLTFLVNPHLGSQTINGESVVVSDKEKASSLYEAVRRDTVSAWIAQNPTFAGKSASNPE